MPAPEKSAGPPSTRQRLLAILRRDSTLLENLGEAEKTFKKLGVKAVWKRFERELLAKLERRGIHSIENEEASHALALQVEELRIWLIGNFHNNPDYNKETAEALVVRLQNSHPSRLSLWF